ncbi:hypothetical protein AC579_10267 [Pseudocercospora musae]|uniref:Uncharacterized protein n=1 Tax=Pseudocercospora musae TaxID=113226 RepID=A0A139I5D6_9PEZI|nr:hypothetical protein AC579_10267 [Pseudocercospora musae]
MAELDPQMPQQAAVVLAKQAAELSADDQLAKLTDDWAVSMEELGFDEQNALCKKIAECSGGSTSLTDTCSCHTSIWRTRERQNDPVRFTKDAQTMEPVDGIRTEFGKTTKVQHHPVLPHRFTGPIDKISFDIQHRPVLPQRFTAPIDKISFDIQHRPVLPHRFTGPIDKIGFDITRDKLKSSRDLDKQSSKAVPSSMDVSDEGTWYAARDLIGYSGEYVDAQRHLTVGKSVPGYWKISCAYCCKYIAPWGPYSKHLLSLRLTTASVLHLPPVVEKGAEAETSEMMDKGRGHDGDDDMTAEDWINEMDPNGAHEHEVEQDDDVDYKVDDKNPGSDFQWLRNAQSELDQI